MRTNFRNVALALLAGLCASCTQSELLSSVESGEVEKVSVSAGLPHTLQTRALPGGGDSHTLRCVLEVYDKDSGNELMRFEKLGTEATDEETLKFEFEIDKDVNYQCLFWADFIVTPEAAPQAEGGYTDKYYNTQDLKAVSYLLADNSVFNNDYADAFCAVVDKNGTTTSLSATLKRPFTKLVLKDVSDLIAGCTHLKATYKTPDGFNVADGTAATTKDVVYNGEVTNATEKVWFTSFIFAPVDTDKLESPITMTLTTSGGEEQTKTVLGGQITLDANLQNSAQANFSDKDNVTIEAGIDNGYKDTSLPQVGQFVYNDGTWGDTYDEQNVIAVVFAQGAKGGDVPANYGTNFEGKTIAGYAMAVKSIGYDWGQYFPENSIALTVAESPWNGDYDGFVKWNELHNWLDDDTSTTSALMETKWDAFVAEYPITAGNLSPWYVPSASQLFDMVSLTLGCTVTDYPVTKVEAIMTALNACGANKFINTMKDGVYLLSSTVTKTGDAIASTNNAYLVINSGATLDAEVLAGKSEAKTQSRADARPVITLFKQQN